MTETIQYQNDPLMLRDIHKFNFKNKSYVDSDLYNYMISTNDLESLRNNPLSILSTIELFSNTTLNGSKISKKHLNKISKQFEKSLPITIVQTGIEKDYGYSLIYLINEYIKIFEKNNYESKPSFIFYAFELNSRSINIDNRTTNNKKTESDDESVDDNLINYLIELAGFKDYVKIIRKPSIFQCFTSLIELLNNKNTKLEMFLYNCNIKNEKNDLIELRMAESLGLIEPGITVIRLDDYSLNKNDFDESNSIYYSYLLGSPNDRRHFINQRKFNDSNELLQDYHLPNYPGRWNIIYEPLDDNDPCFVKCADFLDS
ncbi:hypothetical protein B5S31_g1431 [[Candida] boidinii]|nr:hypothetical protein B5S31_g1431 [[Candida] boidinii]